MPYRDFNNQSIQHFLLWRFLPLILLAITIVTGWTMYAVYLNARLGGEHWAHTSLQRFQSEINDIADEVMFARSAIEQSSGRYELIKLPSTYTILDVTADPAKKNYAKTGIYSWRGDLSYILPFRLKAASGKPRDILLIRRIPNSFADHLSVVLGTEVEILMLEPQPHVDSSSWKNLRGESLSSQINEARWKQLAGIRDGIILNGEGVFVVPDYRGLQAEYKGEFAWHRGEDRFRAFFAYLPVVDPRGKRIGYFSVIIPEDVVMAGVTSGMLISGIFSFIVALLSTWLIVRTSRQVSRPIAALSNRILAMTESISAKSGIEGIELPRPPKPVSENEIQTLAYGVDLLEIELERAEAAKQIVFEERERTQFASKMAALGEMSANVAHEINNPVAVIHALADELSEKALRGAASAEDTVRMAKVIKDTATRVANIIRALLKLSRDSETDPMEWNLLQDLIGDALVLVRDQMTKHGIRLNVSGLETPISIKCRGAQITQVILNLLSNAVDALEGSGIKVIDLQIARGSNSVWISIIDTGPGVAERIRERVMEPFVTTKPPGRGTGLGLSISKHIVHEHHGKMFFDQGKSGTRFVFGLPIDFDNHPASRIAPEAGGRA